MNNGEEQVRNPKDYDVVSTPLFKLKDRPKNRRYQVIDLKKQFRTKPDVIIVEKLQGKNNLLIVRAFVKKSETQKIIVPRQAQDKPKKDDAKVIKKKKTP